jgi:WD40 repeat protein
MLSRQKGSPSRSDWATLVFVLVGAWLLVSALSPEPPAARAAEPRDPQARPTRKVGDWEVTTVGFARDRRIAQPFEEQHRLVIALDSDAPQLWDTRTGKRVAVLREQEGMDSCAASPDGTRLLTADLLDGNGLGTKKIVRSIRIWDLDTGKLRKTVPVDLSAKGVRFSTDWTAHWLDKRRVLLHLHCRPNPARASGQTVLALIDAEEGVVQKMSGPLDVGEELDLSPDGRRAAAGHSYGVWREDDGEITLGGFGTTYSVDLIDLDKLEIIGKLDDARGKGDRSVVRKVWSADSRRVATTGNDHTVRVWDGDKGKPVSLLKGHTDWVLSTGFSPDGRTLLTASDDGTARLWDVESGKELVVLSGHTAGLNRAVFEPAGKRVVTAGEDGTARLWDAATGKPLRAWGGHESPVRNAVFVAGGAEVRTETARGVVRRWSVNGGSLLEEKKETGRWSGRHGALFLMHNDDGSVEAWAGPSGAPGEGPGEARPVPRQTIRGTKGFAAVAATPDGKHLAAVDGAGAVWLWEPAKWDKVTGAGRTKLPWNPVKISCLAFAPGGKLLAAGCRDGSVALWDVAAAKETALFKAHAGDVQALAFSADGALLASGGAGKLIVLWDVTAEKERSRIEHGLHSVTSLAFSAGGKTLATGGRIRDWKAEGKDDFYRPGQLKLWDVADGAERYSGKGFGGAVTCVAFAPDGAAVLAGSADRTASLWDARTGRRLAALRGGDEAVDGVAFSPDGKLFATAHSLPEGGVSLWDATTRKEASRFLAHPHAVGLLLFLPGGKTLVTAGPEGQIKFWDVAELMKQKPPQ